MASLLDLDDGDEATDAALAADSPRDLAAAHERDAGALGEDPRAAPLWLAAGRVYEGAVKDVERAAVCYERAVRLDPSHGPAVASSRRLQSALGNWIRVEELLEREAEIEKDPDTLAAVYVELARVRESKLNQRDSALDAYAEARKIKPGGLLEERVYYQKLRERNQILPAYEVLDGFAASVSEPAFRADLHRELAQLAGPKLGDPDVALQHHLEVVERDVADAAAFSAVTRMLRKENKHAELAAMWSKRGEALGQGEAAATAHYRAARIFRDDLGDEPRAIAELQRAVERAPSYPLALSELVRLFEGAGRWPELLVLLEKEAELTDSPEERAHRFFRVGQIYEEKIGDEAKALTFLQQTVALRPGYLPALQSLGKIYSRTGKWSELAAMYEAEILAMPDSALKVPRLFKLAEVVDARLGDEERAITLYQRVLELEPGYVPASNALERLFARAKRHEQLIALYEDEIAASLEDEHKIAVLEKIARIADEQLHDLERAIAAYKAILDVESDHLRTIRALGQIYTRAERWQDLVDTLELEAGLTNDQKQVVDLHYRRGEIYEERLGDKERAIAVYKQVLALAPSYLPTLRSLGRLYLQKGRWQELALMYRQEIEVTGTEEQAAILHFKIGELMLEKLIDEDGAVLAFEAVLSIVPAHRQALALLGQIYRSRGLWQKLIDVIAREAKATNDPRLQAARYFEAGELSDSRLGEPQMAITLYQRALAASPGFGPAEDALLSAWTEAGEFRAVSVQLRKRIEETLEPSTRLALLKRLGEVSMRELGDSASAMKAYEEAVAIDRNDVHALLQLERLYTEKRELVKLASLLDRLADLASEPKLKIAYHLQAAAVKENDLEPPEPSEGNYRAVLLIEPENPLALRALDMQLHRSHDAIGLGQLYERMAGKASAGRARALLVERAEMVLDAGGDPMPLLGALEALVQDEPQDLLALRVLRRVYDKIGHWEGFLRLSEAEGRMTVDPARAAKLLTDVGLVQWKKSHDLAAAKATFQAALARDSEARVAFFSLTELLSQAEAWAELAELLAKQKGTRGEHSIEAGSIYFAKLNDHDKARACFEDALARDPERPEAHMALGELCALGGDPMSAVEHYSRALKGQTSNEQTALVHAKLAELYVARLSDTMRGQQHLRAALHANPLDLVTLDVTLRVLGALGDVAAAKAVLTRMIQLTEPLEDKAKRCVALGDMLLRSGDEAGAQAAFERAVELWPEVPLPAERMLSVYERSGNWKRLLEILHAQLPRAQGVERALLHARIAAVHAEHGKDFVQAVAEMKMAAALAPEDAGLRERLGLYLAATAATQPEAVVQFRTLLDKDPFRPQTLRALCRVYAQQRANDKAFCFAEALVFLRAADAEEQNFFNQGRERVAHAIDDVIAAQDLRSLLLEPVESGPIGEIFEALSGELSELYPPAHSVELFEKSDRLGAKSVEALRVAVDAVGKTLAVPELNVLVADVEPHVCIADTGSPPSLIVSRELARRVQPVEQRFYLGRALLGLRQGHPLLRRVPGPELSVFVAAVVMAAYPDYEPEERMADRVIEVAKGVRAALSRKAKKALEGPAKALAASDRIFDLRPFITAAEKSELRAGVLLSASLETATRALAKLHGVALPQMFESPQEAVVLLNRVPGFLPMFQFFLSEQHFLLRQKLRIAIDA